jgi:MoaA/NifB/PqqE/SkfB family radical SAM enzyme
VNLGRFARWARTGLPRTARLAAARVAGRPLPYSITFLVTTRCNFACSHCDLATGSAEEMTTGELMAAIDELARAGMARASFSGGEALLRPDLPDLVAHAKRRGAFTSLNSNGWLAPAALGRLAGSLDMIVLSLDGDAALHDNARGQPGSFARTIEAIRVARSAGITVATITVLTGRNREAVGPVLDLADRYGFWAYFQPAHRTCFDPAAGVDPAVHLGELAGALDRARRARRRVGASAGFLRRLARGPAFSDCARCAAGRWFGLVMPDGELVPCFPFVRPPAERVNGRAVGFARAFREMRRPPPGPGCAVSPYQEMDLALRLDPSAIRAALCRAFFPPPVRP